MVTRTRTIPQGFEGRRCGVENIAKNAWENAMARAVEPERIEAAKSRLRALPEKPKAPKALSIAEAIRQIKNEVRAALKRGYTFDEIAQALKEDGIDVGTPTLKSYVSRSNKKRPPAKTAPNVVAKTMTTNEPRTRTGSKAIEMPANL